MLVLSKPTTKGRDIMTAKDMHTVYMPHRGCLQPVEIGRPTTPPRECGFTNEDLECMGCGQKLGCIQPGHCYAVEGEDAFKWNIGKLKV